MGARMALAFIIFAGVSAGGFFLFLCYTIYRVFLTIAQKQVREQYDILLNEI